MSFVIKEAKLNFQLHKKKYFYFFFSKLVRITKFSPKKNMKLEKFMQIILLSAMKYSISKCFLN